MNLIQKFNEFKIFFRFVKKYWHYEVLMLVLILIGTACSLAAPFVLGKIIDDVIPSSNQNLLFELVTIMAGINVIRFFVGISSDYLNSWLSGHIMTDIKERLFANLLKMPFSYFEKNKPGEVIQVISNEVDKIQYFLTTGMIRFLNNVFILFSLAGLLCYLNYHLFIITLFLVPIVVFINGKVSKRVRDLVKNTGIKEGELYNFYFERVKNISLIKLFDSLDFEATLFKNKTKNLILLNLKNTKLSSLGSNGSSFFISLSPLVLLLVGGYEVMNHTMSIGALVAFIQYCNRLIPPTNDFLSLYIDYVRAHESSKRILPYLDRPTETVGNDNILGNRHIQNIKCNGMGFTIDNTTILSDINIEFESGVSYGIIGNNGAGKSTLIKIISKLYDPTMGNVIINDEVSLSELSAKEWCNYVTVITQQPQILHESIRNNLIYANRNATEDELWKSLESVNLKNYVQSLPKGLDTLIGDGDDCANPSGGQTQKISLARAILKQSDIILLDEVTSAMDNSSRREVLDLILKAFSDKIIICITHDVTDVMLLDKVIMMEAGELVEVGSPNALLTLNGKYKEFFKYN